jgi:hypothetical protein
MDKSIFTNKEQIPAEEDLRLSLGITYELWGKLREFTLREYPAAVMEWNYPGEKYGWSFRIKDKKRAILYLLPRDGFFRIAFVFGQKATDQILSAKVSEVIRKELKEAKVYAEGRGIRIDVRDGGLLDDLRELIRIKLSN